MARWVRPGFDGIPDEWRRVAAALQDRLPPLAETYGGRGPARRIVDETLRRMVADPCRRNRLAVRYLLGALGHSGADEWPELAEEEHHPDGCQAHIGCRRPGLTEALERGWPPRETGNA